MKKFLFLVVIAGFVALVWQIGSRLSADAIGMAIGVLFGVLAGVPAALLVMASGRRREEREQMKARPDSPYALPAHGPQAPVIVLAGPGFAGPQAQANGAYPFPQDRLALPAPQQQEAPNGRQFKVVGETEAWIDEW